MFHKKIYENNILKIIAALFKNKTAPTRKAGTKLELPNRDTETLTLKFPDLLAKQWV